MGSQIGTATDEVFPPGSPGSPFLGGLMSDALSFVEVDSQHVELLPARTVMSLLPLNDRGGRGGNAGDGGKGGQGRGGIGLNILNIDLFGDQINDAGDGVGGAGGSADGGGGGDLGS
jgi:hypothetical protein